VAGAAARADALRGGVAEAAAPPTVGDAATWTVAVAVGGADAGANGGGRATGDAATAADVDTLGSIKAEQAAHAQPARREQAPLMAAAGAAMHAQCGKTEFCLIDD
jgi:ribosomal protein L10